MIKGNGIVKFDFAFAHRVSNIFLSFNAGAFFVGFFPNTFSDIAILIEFRIVFGYDVKKMQCLMIVIASVFPGHNSSITFIQCLP